MEEKTLYLPTEHNDRIVAFIGSPLGLLAVVGGSVGALLGMLVFRHKTLHRVFRVGVPVILAVQLLLAAAITLYWNFLR